MIIEPYTAEWFDARCGRVTASRIHDATKRLKNGAWSTERTNYMTELAVERLTGVTTRHYVSDAMLHGIENEPDAIAALEFALDVDVHPIGFVQHPTIYQSGATPDGAVGDVGLVEVKAPTSKTHIETILTKEIDPRYIAQMAWHLACCPDREYVDFGTYDPRMPPDLQLWVFRYMRDEKYIAALEADVREFLDELEDMVEKLKSTGRLEAAA